MSKLEWQQLLGQEAGVVWLEDIDKLDYVRTWDRFQDRSRDKPPRVNVRVVGYTVLRSDAVPLPSGWFWRRVFWLSATDRDRSPNGSFAIGMPANAIDPRTVLPGEPGRITSRAWFGSKRPVDSHDLLYPTHWFTDAFYEDGGGADVPSS